MRLDAYIPQTQMIILVFSDPWKLFHEIQISLRFMFYVHQKHVKVQGYTYITAYAHS